MIFFNLDFDYEKKFKSEPVFWKCESKSKML